MDFFWGDGGSFSFVFASTSIVYGVNGVYILVVLYCKVLQYGFCMGGRDVARVSGICRRFFLGGRGE